MLQRLRHFGRRPRGRTVGPCVCDALCWHVLHCCVVLGHHVRCCLCVLLGGDRHYSRAARCCVLNSCERCCLCVLLCRDGHYSRAARCCVLNSCERCCLCVLLCRTERSREARCCVFSCVRLLLGCVGEAVHRFRTGACSCCWSCHPATWIAFLIGLRVHVYVCVPCV